MPNTKRVEPFAVLADIYRAAGFADYSAALAPALLNVAFDLEWTGRSLLDLACGTGDLACWYAGHGFRVSAVDNSAAMLHHASKSAATQSVHVDFVQADMRSFEPPAVFEMVTCVGGSLNYLPAIKDLEAVFRLAANALEPGKLFIFDLHTIRGLANSGGADRLVADNSEDYTIITRSTFSFETLSLTRQYLIFTHDGTAGWQRSEETHLLRGYPLQGVLRMLGPLGLRVVRTLTPDLEPAGDRHDAEQLLFVALKEA